jgi:hypothetical protein
LVDQDLFEEIIHQKRLKDSIILWFSGRRWNETTGVPNPKSKPRLTEGPGKPAKGEKRMAGKLIVPVSIAKIVPEGEHTGTIVEIEQRTDPYNYTDFIVAVDGEDVNLRIGFPTYISVDAEKRPRSGLAKFLQRLDVSILKESVDLEVVKGKRIVFKTYNEPTPTGTFARIIPDTVRLLAK